MGDHLGVPSFHYGPERSLPEVRREAFLTLEPDAGPPTPHPTAGASAVGSRPLLVAYNVWISVDEGGTADAEGALAMAREIAATVRTPAVRSLGLAVGSGAQVSCNLVDPLTVSVTGLVDAIAHLVSVAGGSVDRTELVGLVPAELLQQVPRDRWAELDLSEDRTIEARMDGPGDTGGASLNRAAQEALTTARRCMARWRRRRRRSRSDRPPQIPNFSPLARAYSRQSSRTTHPLQTSLASRVDAPRSGKKRSGSTPMQFALVCQLRSWRPYIIDTMSTGSPPLTTQPALRTTDRIARL